MSAYVVEDATINRVISFLAMDRDLEHIRRRIVDGTGANIETEEGKKQLGTAMLALNCNAVDQRYGSGESSTFRDDMGYTYSHEHTNKIQAYKSLKCWLYQCAEGDVPDTSLLYSTMERVAWMLADDIVTDLPAFDKAKWD